MDKTITIRDKEITFRMHAGIPFLFKQKFKKDLITSFSKYVNGEIDDSSYDLIGELAYIAAKEADKDVPDDPMEWFKQFEVTDMSRYIIPAVSELWQGSSRPSVTPKKHSGKSTAK